MGKILDKIKKKKAYKRITNETIKEHREEVLSTGRKFKYPLQYTKHRLVVNAILIGVGALSLLVALGWANLYRFQNMSDIMYRLTKILPVPVAQIDNEPVRYSDFLMIYRSSVAAIENQQGKLTDSEADNLLKDQYKRRAMSVAQEYTYAKKLARELGIKITEDQVKEAEKEHRRVDGVERSEESFSNIIKINFGLSVEEYRRLLTLSLTKKEVSEKIDTEALAIVQRVKDRVKDAAEDWAMIAEEFKNEVLYEDTGGFVDILNLDGGRAEMTSKLKPGESSDSFVSKNGDAYYLVKLLAKENNRVSYVSMKINFREFDHRMEKLKEENRIHEYIKFNFEKSEK